jgi:hypothetical protein
MAVPVSARFPEAAAAGRPGPVAAELETYAAAQSAGESQTRIVMAARRPITAGSPSQPAAGAGGLSLRAAEASPGRRL